MASQDIFNTQKETFVVERQAHKMAEGEQRLQTWIEQIEGLLSRRAAKQMSMSVILQNMPSVPEEDVDKLLTTCSRPGLYDCMILAAVRYGRIERLLRFVDKDLTPELRHLLQGNLLEDLVAEGVWPSWDGFIQTSYTDDEAVALFRWILFKSVNSEALALFEMLIGRVVPEHYSLRDLIIMLTAKGPISMYQSILNIAKSKAEHLGDDSNCLRWDTFYLLLVTCFIHRKKYQLLETDLNGRLVAACCTGLCSVPYSKPESNSPNEYITILFDYSPIYLAVYCNQPDMVQFFYSTGTVSNREVFQLSQDADLIEKCSRDVTTQDLDHAASDDYPSRDNVLAAREIRSFLVAKASQPRSLKSLCFAEVSKGLGWGNARKVAVKEMDIPLTLKADLMTNCDRTVLHYKRKKEEEKAAAAEEVEVEKAEVEIKEVEAAEEEEKKENENGEEEEDAKVEKEVEKEEKEAEEEEEEKDAASDASTHAAAAVAVDDDDDARKKTKKRKKPMVMVVEKKKMRF